ncbi:hypothetical protein [Aquicoccus porphyridii]|uniref:hypothetical protein n=1 Tax=Aquicoccus porphyridii TaxID=1852029 RepID=UPI00273D48C1|nr:hypothetical protein [Aquicoccus porphyridii]
MPVTYDIDKTDHLVTARYSGNVTLDEIAAMFSAYVEDPDFRTDRPHLADLSGVTGTDIGFAETYTLFSMFLRSYAQPDHHLRIAIHALDPATFGIARIFQNLAESSDAIDVELFDTPGAARNWALSRNLASTAPPQG